MQQHSQALVRPLHVTSTCACVLACPRRAVQVGGISFVTLARVLGVQKAAASNAAAAPAPAAPAPAPSKDSKRK